MQKTNALNLRQSLGSILKKLAKTGEPILIERNREPAAVLISLEDYKTRFVDREADRNRHEMIEELKRTKMTLPPGKTSVDLIRELREGGNR